jgi:hypothetical protein
MATSTPDTVVAAERLLEALTELRRCTRLTEESIRGALKQSQQGKELAAVVSAAGPASLRKAMNDSLKGVEEARHEMRRIVFATALDEGTSIGELARLFGFSRQLAARYAKEARHQA